MGTTLPRVGFCGSPGVMKEDGERWCGRDTVLVQCGRRVGPHELHCFGLLVALDDGHVPSTLWATPATGDQKYRETIGTVALDQAVDSQYWRSPIRRQPTLPMWATYEPGGILAEPPTPQAVLIPLSWQQQHTGTILFHFGVDLSSSSSSGVHGGGDDEEQEDAGPKTWSVSLVSFDAKSKIKVIKEVRSVVPDLGLKEAKAVVESVPKTIVSDLSDQQEATAIQEKLQQAGAVVELVAN